MYMGKPELRLQINQKRKKSLDHKHRSMTEEQKVSKNFQLISIEIIGGTL